MASKDDEHLDYDYLLGMSFWHLTLEKKNELLRKKEEKCTELDILKQKTPSDLWNEDLDAFLEKVNLKSFIFNKIVYTVYCDRCENMSVLRLRLTKFVIALSTCL